MNARTLLPACLFVLAACGVVPLPTGTFDPMSPPPLRAQDAEFLNLSQRWFGIWSSDPAAIADAEALYAEDADALFFDGFVPAEGTFGSAGWRAVARRAMVARFDEFELKPREGVWLRRHGDRAVLSIPFEFKLSAAGRSIASDGHTSLVCERRDGVWKVVHEHTGLTLADDWIGGLGVDLRATEQDHIHPADAEFQRLVDAYLAELDASRTADITRANAPSRFFAPDVDVLVFEPTSRRPLQGWSGVAAYRDAPDLRIYLTNRRSRQDVRVWKSGDWAWATFTFIARATRRDGDRFEIVGRQTDVFQRIDGRWLIVHEHASVPYAPEGTPGVRAEIVLSRSTPATTRSIPRLPVVLPEASMVDAPADRIEFERRIEDYATAWTTDDRDLDWVRVLRLYAPPEQLTFLEGPQGPVPALRSIDERRAAVYPGRNVSLAPHSDLHVTRNGNVAWTTSSYDFVGTAADGAEVRRVLYQTAVWERRGLRWVIVNEHLSTVE